MKKVFYLLLITGAIICLAPIGLYFWIFRGPLSTNINDWNTFGSLFYGSAIAVITIVNISVIRELHIKIKHQESNKYKADKLIEYSHDFFEIYSSLIDLVINEDNFDEVKLYGSIREFKDNKLELFNRKKDIRDSIETLIELSDKYISDYYNKKSNSLEDYQIDTLNATAQSKLGYEILMVAKKIKKIINKEIKEKQAAI